MSSENEKAKPGSADIARAQLERIDDMIERAAVKGARTVIVAVMHQSGDLEQFCSGSNADMVFIGALLQDLGVNGTKQTLKQGDAAYEEAKATP